MPKKQIEDDEDIIEIEEFPEQKQGKSTTKQNTDKKAKKQHKKQPLPSESEEDESEEEPEEPVRKSKAKKATKKPISDKRLEILKKGREIAAANRAKKKAETIENLKKELWDDFNGKLPKPQSLQVPPPLQSLPVPQVLPSQPHEIISRMKDRASLEPTQTVRKIKSFSKIK